MDYVNQPNPEVHNQLLCHNSKRTIKFMLSYFSLFCVLFSLLPLLLQSFRPFLMQFFTFDKSYMFLLCNGLLVFIAKGSGLINGSSPGTNQSKEVVANNEKSSRLEFKASETAVPIAAEIDMEIEYPQAEEKSSMIVGQEDGLSDTQEGDEERNTLMIIDEDEHAAEDREELNKKCEYWLSDTQDGEEEGNAHMIIDEDEHAAEDTEELNRKCEDFIKKMKAAFCSEPRDYYCSDFDSHKTLVAVQ